MNRILGIVIIAAGAILLFYGVQASHSFSSGVSRVFTGSPTDHTIWLMVAGFAVLIAGLVVLMRGGKS